MKAIIIEDEVIAAKELQSLIIETDSGIDILSILQSIDESVEWFRSHPMPDIVFMDIHLADGSSFSIFEEVNISCPVVFTTAYDEYALKAFEVNSIDYLLKPINKKDLERAISKFKNLKVNPEDNVALLNKLIEGIKQTRTDYKKYFLVPEKDRLIPLVVNDIAYIYIDSGIVKAITSNNKTFYLDQTLDDIGLQLDPARFFRANRQFIVSKLAIKDMSFWFGGKLSLNLSMPVPERIFISKAKVAEFKKWFAG